MEPISKLPIKLTDANVEGHEDLSKWQAAINSSIEMDSLATQSLHKSADGTALWDRPPKEKNALINHLLREQHNVCCFCGKVITKEEVSVEHMSPKSKFPNLTFDYTNLFASCKGGNPKVKRINPEEEFSLKELAEKREIPIERLSIKNEKTRDINKRYKARTTVEHEIYTKEEGFELHCNAKKNDEIIVYQPISADRWIESTKFSNENYWAKSTMNKITFEEDGTMFLEGKDDHNDLKTLNLNIGYLKNKRKIEYELVEEFLNTLDEDTEINGVQSSVDKNKIIQAKIAELLKQPEGFPFVRIYFLKMELDKTSS